MIKAIKDKISEFLGTSIFFRKIRIISKNILIPITLKILIIFIVFVIISFFAVKHLNPSLLKDFRNEISRKFYKIAGLDSRNFSRISISGNSKISDQQIMDIILAVEDQYLETNSKDYQPLIHDIIDEIRSQINWITDIRINRILPDILNIVVEEFKPFALWVDDSGNKFLIDKKGNSILQDQDLYSKNLIILSGKDADMHIASLFNILTLDQNISSKVYSATWVGRRRWDIRLNNDIIIKLPENNLANAWKMLDQIFQMSGSDIDLESIDLRVDGKIFLKYKGKTRREITNL